MTDETRDAESEDSLMTFRIEASGDVETPERDDIYLETTKGEVFRQLNAFIEDASRKRFDRNRRLLGLVGLFQWLSWRRNAAS